MQTTVAVIENVDSRRKTLKIGFWSAILTAVFTLVTFALAITALPISGPNCQSNCVAYPYSNVASQIPHDFIWMYPALVPPLLFVILVVCIHQFAPASSKLYSQIGLSFAVMYAVLISIDYYIQLVVVQPSILRGEMDGLAPISQYNPHGLFIALEDLGYLMLGIAFFFFGAVFAGRTQLERAIRWLFTISSLLVLATFVLFHLIYGYDLEYRFEVLVISIDWLTLIVEGILLSILFRRNEQSQPI